jgi:acyl transferase domain-containing protein/acyl carrier protein
MDHPEELLERAELDIAIIGMAGRFPGANDVDTFWRNLQDGLESVTFYTDEELLARGVPPKVLEDPHYVKAGAHLEGVDLFDASFFGYTPREAAETDPQHRLFLEVAWQALEDAGYDASTYRAPIGVYAGCGLNTYLLLNLFPNGRFSDMQDVSSLQGLMNGNNKDSMTTAVSYKLNLRGPAITVQTACSTSLAAVHMASRGLLNHEADMAMAGGVWVNQLHDDGYRYQPGAILSPDGHCRAFDARAAGTIVGSGVGIVVLKRLSDAVADGDTIHAVIKGSAMNNDGSAKVGYTAPSVEGQAEVILAAQAIADVPADTVSYIEAHGTGTTMGDPIEVAALTQAFRESTQRRGFCGIGSVKTNIGHLDAAAGVAGLIKTALALKHQVLPPSLNFEQPNPHIDFSSSPFYVNTASKAWPSGSTPRRAGVSSFGIGGTNVHVVIEESPPADPSGPSRSNQILALSARTGTALEAMVIRLRNRLSTRPELPLADVAYTLLTGRKGFPYRAVALCCDGSDAISILENQDPDRFFTGQAELEKPEVAFLFPGQGAQYVDMARDLYRDEPVFRREFDRCADLLKPYLDFDLLTLVHQRSDRDDQAEASARIAQTEVTQPALFVVEYALARLWMSWGIIPTAMIGHSVGEYVAACLADVFSLEDALRLVALRARLLQRMETGAMLSVMLPEAEIALYLNEHCDLAAVNGPELCVLSGVTGAIEAIEAELGNRGIVTRRLHVSHAFHSGMIEPVLPVFVDMVAKTELRQPKIPFLSNVSGDWITAQETTDPDYWGRHLRRTVRFHEGLRELLIDPSRVLLEVGPGETLTTLAKRHPDAKPEQLILSSLPHPAKARLASSHFYLCLGKLWLKGMPIDWETFYANERRHRVSLPTYPFERQSYWVKPEGGSNQVPARAPDGDGLHMEGRNESFSRSVDDWFYEPSWRRENDAEPVRAFTDSAGCVAIFTDEHQLGSELSIHLSTGGIEPVVISPGTAFRRHNKDYYTVRPGRREDYDLLLRAIREEGRTIRHIFHLWSMTIGSEVRSHTESLTKNFFSLFYLGQALESVKGLIASGTKVEITVITNRLGDVTGSEQLDPEKATLLGPCKVIPQEYSYLTCRVVDVELRTSDEVAKTRLVRQLLAEAQADHVRSIVAYRGPQRWIQTFEPVQCLPLPHAPTRLRQHGVYFITGGLGGIGLTLAEHLARTQKAKLVLLGRSPIPSREHWPKVLSTSEKSDSTRRKIEKVLQLEAFGAEVLVLQADVAIQAELKAAVAQTRLRFGTIHGVIHSAGEVGSGLISAKTEDMVSKVFAPKLQGTHALLAVFKSEPMDFMVLCSSLASIAGGLSKVDYCAANAYLDAVARAAYCDSGLPVISVNWDSWREVGMAASMALPDGVGIAPDEGAKAFERIVNSVVRPQVIVSTLDLNARLTQTQEDLVAQPFAFTDRGKQGEEQRHPRPALQTIFTSPDSELEKSIAEIWQSLLGLDAVGTQDNLFELGGDSLLGIQLLSRVRAAFGVDMHPADFFRVPTVAGLAELVEMKLLDEIECS